MVFVLIRLLLISHKKHCPGTAAGLGYLAGSYDDNYAKSCSKLASFSTMYMYAQAAHPLCTLLYYVTVVDHGLFLL